MRGKKKVSLAMAAILAASLLAGCGAKEDGGDGAQQPDQSYSLYIGNAWTATMFDAGNKDVVLQELEKKTGISLDVELVKSSDVNSEINVMLASGDLPDLIVADGETRTQMIRDGYVIALDDLIEKCAPDMKKNLGFVFPNGGNVTAPCTALAALSGTIPDMR